MHPVIQNLAQNYEQNAFKAKYFQIHRQIKENERDLQVKHNL